MADQMTGILSPFLRNRRLGAARPWLDQGRVLDVGCGVGAMTAFVPPERYLGVDLDPESVEDARRRHPRHAFMTVSEFEANPTAEPFDVIVALAVIEHIDAPAQWLDRYARRLKPSGCFVLTTPHPMFDWVHETGAKFGIFSREAADEHEELIDRRRMAQIAQDANLTMATYRRFLLGANQLFVLRPRG